MEKVTNSSALRSNLSLVLDEVQFNQDSYVIERKGRPAAVIVPLNVYDNWKRSRERFFDVVRQIQAANQDADDASSQESTHIWGILSRRNQPQINSSKST